MSDSTRFTLLGMVRRRPSTYGYALVDEAQRWSAPQGVAPTRRAIYHALTVLSDAGWIEPLESPTDRVHDGPQRRRFVTTSEGERHYQEWLRTPPASSVEFFRRVATARREDLPILLKLVISEQMALLAEHREQHVPEVDKLVARGAPWEEIMAALLGFGRLNELASQITFLYSLRRALEELLAKPTDQGRTS